jgi:hypothetical protein
MKTATSQFKSGDRVIWLRSPGRSFLTGWRVQEVPGVITRICRRRIRIRIWRDGREKLVNVDPENVLGQEHNCDCSRRDDS